MWSSTYIPPAWNATWRRHCGLFRYLRYPIINSIKCNIWSRHWELVHVCFFSITRLVWKVIDEFKFIKFLVLIRSICALDRYNFTLNTQLFPKHFSETVPPSFSICSITDFEKLHFAPAARTNISLPDPRKIQLKYFHILWLPPNHLTNYLKLLQYRRCLLYSLMALPLCSLYICLRNMLGNCIIC